MAVISGSDYVALATDYANARDTILAAKDDLFDAVYAIVLLQSIQPEVDLLSVFWDTYKINLDTLQAPTLFLAAVRALNNHVLIEGGYETIDSFLQATGEMIPQSWADLSREAGYTISPAYIS